MLLEILDFIIKAIIFTGQFVMGLAAIVGLLFLGIALFQIAMDPLDED